MEGFDSAWFIAVAIGILLVATDRMIPKLRRDRLGWVLLTVGIILLLAGVVGLGRNAYLKYTGKPKNPQVASSNIDDQPRNRAGSQEKSRPPAAEVPPKSRDKNRPQTTTAPSSQNTVYRGLTQGAGSIAQIGGSGNSATVNNFGTIEWHLGDPQKAALGVFADSLPDQAAQFVVVGDILDKQSQTYASDLFDVLAAHHRVNRRGHILSMGKEFPKGVSVAVHDTGDASFGMAQRIVSEMRSEGIPVGDVSTSDQIRNHEIHIIVGLMPTTNP